MQHCHREILTGKEIELQIRPETLVVYHVYVVGSTSWTWMFVVRQEMQNSHREIII